MAMSKYAVNPDSHCWKEVKQFHHDELAKARAMLEQTGVDQVKTEFIRGKIDAHKRALKLGERDSGHSEI